MDTKQLDELEKLHRDFTNSQSVLRYDALSMAATRALPSLISQAREAIALRDKQGRMFPLQRDRGVKPGPLSIPWSIGEKAWQAYTVKFHNDQTCETIARRGGFSWGEMDEFYPQWREEIDDLAALHAENERLRAEVVKECIERIQWMMLGARDGSNTAQEEIRDRALFDAQETLRALLAPTPEVQR